MAKWILVAGNSEPLSFEGDYITHVGEYVTIFNHDKASNPEGEQVAVIRLGPGNSIHKVSG